MPAKNPFRFSTKYHDDESGLIYYGYRYYNPINGVWLNRDPLGEQGGRNLCGFCNNNSLTLFDALGLSWLQDAANFAAGVADSLTFGMTRQARKGLNWMFSDGFDDQGVDPTSGAYVAGEVVETVAEITVTAGSCTLKQIARKSSRTALEGGARNAYRRANKLTGGVVHHANPIKGHPGGKLAQF